MFNEGGEVGKCVVSQVIVAIVRSFIEVRSSPVGVQYRTIKGRLSIADQKLGHKVKARTNEIQQRNVS